MLPLHGALGAPEDTAATRTQMASSAMNSYSGGGGGGGSAPSQPAPPSGPASNTRLGVSAPVSLAAPTRVDLRLARELEECLHMNNLYESKVGKQLRETVRRNFEGG